MQLSDVSVDKYENLLYLKKYESFLKVCYIFLGILAKKSLGLVLFSMDCWVTTNISIFFLA